jgi:hypothetical protein
MKGNNMKDENKQVAWVFANHKIHKVHLQDYDFLLKALRDEDYQKALTIDKSNQNKEEKIMELLQHKPVIKYINQEW